MNKDNKVDTNATLLDIEINIDNCRFVYYLSDKRDNFEFSIVRFPFKSSNMPSKMFLSTIGAKLFICKASSNFSDFVRCCRPFYKRMLNQGATVYGVKSVFKKFYNRQNAHFSKFHLDYDQIISKLKYKKEGTTLALC